MMKERTDTMIMKRTKKRIFLAVAGGVIVLILGVAFLSSKPSAKDINYDNLPVAKMSASYVIDVDNPEEVVGFSDYLFVAKVTKILGTEYKDEAPIEKADGTIEYIGDPYTKYQIQVIKNIKGDLIVDKEIEIAKAGGVSEDGKVLSLYDDDFLPEVGKTYIFTAFAQEDGSLLVSGANSNIAFDEKESQLKTENSIEKTDEYEEYFDAFENEIEYDREREESKYEEG